MTGAEQLQQLYDEIHESVSARARLELFAEHVLGELAASLHEVTVPSGSVTVCRLDAPAVQQLMRLAEAALGLDPDRRAPCLAQPDPVRYPNMPPADGPARAASIAAQLQPMAQRGI